MDVTRSGESGTTRDYLVWLAPSRRLYIRSMDHQQALALIILGIGGGMMYGRWRYERLKAKENMRKTWQGRHQGGPAKSWKPW